VVSKEMSSLHAHTVPREFFLDVNALAVFFKPVPLVIAVETVGGFLDLRKCFLADLSTCLYEIEVLGFAEVLPIGRGVG